MYTQRIQGLREILRKASMDACIIPMTDPHLGEYPPAHWRIIEWLCGFTGSAGTLVITKDFAGLWTDSRYLIQAEKQLQGTGVQLIQPKIPPAPEYIDWLCTHLSEKQKVAVDGRLLSIHLMNRMTKCFAKQRISIDFETDLIADLWTDRPHLPDAQAWEMDVKYAGETRSDKIKRIRKEMEKAGAAYHLLTSPEDVAWTLNIRGGDVAWSPLVRAFALLTHSDFFLFVDQQKFPDPLKRMLERDGVEFLRYEQLPGVLEGLEHSGTLWFNPASTSTQIYYSVHRGVPKIEEVTAPTRLKAIKNPIEQAHIKQSMIKDGLALVRFFKWLEESLGKDRLTEMSAADKLLEFRKQGEGFLCSSFETISAINANAALPHYTPTAETDTELGTEGLYLLDSGGQYIDGTTDITRTIALSAPTDRQKRDFTLALQGTIRLAMARFPEGTRGCQLDILARKALWEEGLNYGHGTGHGVGFCLNVHEGPVNIAPGSTGDPRNVIQEGMLLSDEPALYREGEYGIRTENLLLCVPDRETPYGKFLQFETVSLCPIDTSLIDTELLSPEELQWLNRYHEKVYRLLSPQLEPDVASWLQQKTRAV